MKEGERGRSDKRREREKENVREREKGVSEGGSSPPPFSPLSFATHVLFTANPGLKQRSDEGTETAYNLDLVRQSSERVRRKRAFSPASASRGLPRHAYTTQIDSEDRLGLLRQGWRR